MNLLKRNAIPDWAALSVIIGLAAVLGAAVVLLPLAYVMGFALVMLAPLWAIVIFGLPKVQRVPYPLLQGVFGFIIFMYFVWPQYVLIPWSALPIKSPQKILYFIYLAVWLGYLAKVPEMRDRLKQSYHHNKLTLNLLIALIAWRLITVFTSELPFVSFYRFVYEISTYFLMVPIAISLVRSDDDIKTLLNWLLAAAVVTSLYAIPEYAIKHTIFARFNTLNIIDPIQAQLVNAPKFRGGNYRAQSSFDHPLSFSEFLVSVLPWALISIMIFKRRWLVVAGVGLIGVGLVLTNSRSSLAGAMVVVGLLLFLALFRNAKNGRTDQWPLIAAIVLLPIALMSAYLFSSPFVALLKGRTALEQGSTFARTQMLDRGLPLVIQKPVAGYGPGMGATKLDFTNTHGTITLDNYYLSAALDSGVTYVFLLIALSIAALFRSMREIGDADPMRAWMFGSMGIGIIGFLIVKAVLGTELNFPLYFLLIGLICANTELTVAKKNV